ncbi:MAG: hypothetical protein IJ300_03210, partial [Clostridia bacterium]|nr:hypothetical protein [Clostridia bacterium]
MNFNTTSLYTTQNNTSTLKKNPAEVLKEGNGPRNLNPQPAAPVYTQKAPASFKPDYLKNASRTGVEIYKGNGISMSDAVNGKAYSNGPAVFGDPNDIPIRQALNGLGYSNDVIGWDSEDVLVGGQKFATPDRNDNGTTKTNSGAFIDAVNKMRINDDLVAVSDYSAKKGLLNNIRYEPDGTVFYGGIKIGNTIQMGDTIYATQSDIDEAIRKSKEATGYKSNKEMMSEALAATASKAKDFSDAVNGFTKEAFSYNPENDATYQNVKNEYIRLAERARKDAYAREAMLNGGYGGSDAQTAGDLAYSEIMSQLLLQMPQYADRAENSYENLYKKNLEAENRYGSEHERNMGLYYDAPAADNELMRQAVESDNNRIETDTQFELDKAAVTADIDNLKWNQGFEEKYYNEITKSQTESAIQQANLQNMSVLADLINNTQDAKGNKLPSYWILMNDEELAQWLTKNAGVYISPNWIREQKADLLGTTNGGASSGGNGSRPLEPVYEDDDGDDTPAYAQLTPEEAARREWARNKYPDL